MNAIEWNRDLTQPVSELRQREQGMKDKPGRGRGTVSLPELRRGGIGVCVATQLARVEHNTYSPVHGWRSPTQAWAMTQGQLAWYRAMLWRDEGSAIEHKPIGYVLSLEGADPLLTPKHLERFVADGLRAVGPAHYGQGIYAPGTEASGGLNALGRELLREAERLGLILDVTHLCDESFWQALDLFDGPLWASHQNCRALVPHMRQFSDEQLRELIARKAVIGCALDAWMLVPGWVRGETTPQSSGVCLDHVVAHMDHICQLAGNARHVGIGSDLDGGFGTEQTPQDLDTIADLTKLDTMLATRGYSSQDIIGIREQNFVNFLRRAWE